VAAAAPSFDLLRLQSAGVDLFTVRGDGATAVHAGGLAIAAGGLTVAAGGVAIGDQDLVEDELKVVSNEFHGLKVAEMGAFDDLLHGLYCLDQPALFRCDGH
jgi:hypothetical protein